MPKNPTTGRDYPLSTTPMPTPITDSSGNPQSRVAQVITAIREKRADNINAKANKITAVAARKEAEADKIKARKEGRAKIIEARRGY